MKRIHLFNIAAMLISSLIVSAQDYQEAIKLQSSDIDSYDLFGKSVAISGNCH